MTVKYTDIDYNVFTDAARFVWEGSSPYQRSTYRYTPLLAWLLTPNIWFHSTFGKWMFVACDCAVGALIIRITKARGVSDQAAAAYSAIWLLNPQVATISTRGSAESFVCAVVMTSFYAFQRKRIGLGSALFGLSVHLKIYPIMYAFPILAVLDSSVFSQQQAFHKSNSSTTQKQNTPSKITSLFNMHRLGFFAISAGVFLLLNAAMYTIYGKEFLDETYMYHVVRKDHRHNYSMWFLPIYLRFLSPASLAMGLLSFLPQLTVVSMLGVAFGADLYFAAFVQTFAFVAYNKVCTAQYFMWYICFLPVIWPQNSQKMVPKGAILIGVWLGSQALYLQQAYRLEFLGQNTFLPLWLTSVAIFATNNWILGQIISSQRIVPLFGSGPWSQTPPRGALKKTQ
ncbi:GPI mannosyltransferase 1 [Coemansia spiralis]|uniref:GPI mannosyltransferase 1 n=2 Tax=Coemansia TaxID=4863 RepID=A0A9W8G5A1_9FUNG|nr:GPI mannosyltransferase 1 [Coemansia umbellata]KAJ2620431.1 GPI mannosyltransferase 1 [Coemansia sp. RSA 1358]KAJ2673638.1 GPI mannosyltransferase 1 [Coemansia spiralis]